MGPWYIFCLDVSLWYTIVVRPRHLSRMNGRQLHIYVLAGLATVVFIFVYYASDGRFVTARHVSLFMIYSRAGFSGAQVHTVLWLGHTAEKQRIISMKRSRGFQDMFAKTHTLAKCESVFALQWGLNAL